MFTDALPMDAVVDRIIRLNKGLDEFWSNSGGWAPMDAAKLLSRSRLDWQVSLSHSLRSWIRPPTADEAEAWQILGYANVGALVEGTLKLFLSVWYNHYAGDVDAIRRKDKLQDPDEVSLEPLRQFFKRRIWCDVPSDNWDPWIARIQGRRNAIHAFKDRDVGVHAELLADIRSYLRFLRRVSRQLPYPDDGYGPQEATGDPSDWFTDTDAPSL